MPAPVRFIAPQYNNNANNYSLNRNYVIDSSLDEYQNSLIGSNDYDKIGILGTPLYDTIKLSYDSDTYNAVNAPQLGKSIHLEATFDIVKFTVSQKRNIVTTAVNGLNGEIKEFIADGDYTISCNAMIVFDGIDYYDYDFMENIYKIFQIQDSIAIESKILSNVFTISGAKSVVVTDYKFSQPEAGMRNVQAIEFTLITDNKLNYNLIFQ